MCVAPDSPPSPVLARLVVAPGFGEHLGGGGGGDGLVDPAGEGVGGVASGDAVPVGVGDGDASTVEVVEEVVGEPLDFPLDLSLGADLL